MGLSENLAEIKSKADALIDYANDITGAEDTTLGDAVKTLADGYGGGSSEYPKLIWSTEYVLEADGTGTASDEMITNITQSDIEPYHQYLFKITLKEKSEASTLTTYMLDNNYLLNIYDNTYFYDTGTTLIGFYTTNNVSSTSGGKYRQTNYGLRLYRFNGKTGKYKFWIQNTACAGTYTIAIYDLGEIIPGLIKA